MKLKSVLISAMVLLGFSHLGFAVSLTDDVKSILTDAGSTAAGGLVNDDAVDQTDSAAQTNDEAAGTDNYSAFGAENEQQDNNANGQDDNSDNMMDDDSTDEDSSDSNFSGSDNSGDGN